jgi:hypothetical protein
MLRLEALQNHPRCRHTERNFSARTERPMLLTCESDGERDAEWLVFQIAFAFKVARWTFSLRNFW